VRGTKKDQKIYERKRASRWKNVDSMEGFQTSVSLRGCMGRIYSAHDV